MQTDIRMIDWLEDLWHRCPRGDWLLRIAAWASVDRRLIVRAACDCARLAMRYEPVGDDRALLAIEMAEAWCRGEATIEQVQDAAVDAAIADTADDVGSAYFAVCTANVAYVTDSDTAEVAARAVIGAAVYVADTFDVVGAEVDRILRRCAKLVRRRIGWQDVLQAANCD